MRLPASLIAYNVGPRPAWRIVRSLRKIRRDERPDAFALFEAHRALPAIRRRFGEKWHIHATADVVLMIRRDCQQPTVTPARHGIDWWGPKEGIEHHGRAHLVATWDDTLRWVLMHGVPGGPSGGVGPYLRRDGRTHGMNRDAWQADLVAVYPHVRHFPGPVLLAGDLNAEAHELANRFDALKVDRIPTHAHVDHAAQRGLRVRATRLDNYGSDHPAIRYKPIHRKEKP